MSAACRKCGCPTIRVVATGPDRAVRVCDYCGDQAEAQPVKGEASDAARQCPLCHATKVAEMADGGRRCDGCGAAFEVMTAEDWA